MFWMLTEMVLLSTHNVCFGLGIEHKIMCSKRLKGAKSWPCAPVTSLFYGNCCFKYLVNIVFDCIFHNQSVRVFGLSDNH